MRTKVESAGQVFAFGVRRGGDPPGWQAGCSDGWRSSGWPTRALAEARLAQHADEHETGEPAPEPVEVTEVTEPVPFPEEA